MYGTGEACICKRALKRIAIRSGHTAAWLEALAADSGCGVTAGPSGWSTVFVPRAVCPLLASNSNGQLHQEVPAKAGG